MKVLNQKFKRCVKIKKIRTQNSKSCSRSNNNAFDYLVIILVLIPICSDFLLGTVYNIPKTLFNAFKYMTCNDNITTDNTIMCVVEHVYLLSPQVI